MSRNRSMSPPVGHCACAAALLALVGCANPPEGVSASRAAGAIAVECATEGEGWAAEQSATAMALRQQTPSTPLFLAAIAPAGVESCQVARLDRAVSARYLARDGSVLRATYDPSIEYSDQEALLALPMREAPIALLQQAERALFGAKGCGIDWAHPETSAAKTPAQGSDSVYRGEACNCAARLHRTAAGLTDVLGLRSTC